MHASYINEIILLVVAAFIGGYVARSVKLPPVVGYIISGIVFGIVGLAFIPSYSNLFKLSEIGVSLLLFTLGFEISLNTFKKLNRKIIYVAVLQVILTSLFILPILLLFHFSLQISILFAVLFSFSSSAVVLKILEERGMLTNFPGNNVFIILLIQDLFIIPVIFLMPVLFNPQFQFPDTLISFIVSGLKPLAVFIILFILARVFLSRILKLFFRYPQQELTILATIFSATVAIGTLTYAGLPQSIAAFFAGVLISEQGRNMAALSAIKPVRDILLVLFFVLIGMLINVQALLPMLPVIIVATILILIVKFVVLFFVLRYFSFIPAGNVFISSHLTNIGEFAVVIAQIAFIAKFITVSDYQSLLAIFITSLLLIPVITGISKRLYESYKSTKLLKKFMGDANYHMPTTFDQIENHVIILGHGRVGKEVRNLLDMSEIPYIVVDFDRRTIDTLASSMKNSLYGDPTDLDVLKSAGIKKAKILVVALPDGFTQKVIIKNALHLNPKLTVLCRSHIDEDKYELVNLGVNTIVIPEFEAGLRIGKKILELWGFSEASKLDLLSKLRKFHFVH